MTRLRIFDVDIVFQFLHMYELSGTVISKIVLLGGSRTSQIQFMEGRHFFGGGGGGKIFTNFNISAVAHNCVFG